ncbi:MAG TPA: MATE family efflux transporter [Chlamydiales bacterium]|nr:MATE family efflux transporter [Chlamydiales bacterium]
MQNSLTRYPEGSIRELWSISLPLMISTLASLFMIFTDRIFLAHYSLGALNASVNAGTLAWALMSGVGMITAMSEVFVAQYNGARHYKRLGIPVWQMIWFAVFSLFIFVPLAIWGSPIIFAGDRYADLEIPYFRWLMLFSPSFALMMAFSGFFIGRGKTKVLIWLAIIANLINIALDWVLIFGIKGWVPEMGIQGAAIATCFGYFFEAGALGYLFLREENRLKFGAAHWRFNWSEMKKCLKVGVPQGIFCFLEVFGWAVFYWMMTDLGEKHITISSICQSFTILLSFFCDGLSRGSAAVAGNFIGSRRYDLVHKVLKSGFSLLFLFSLATALILVVDPVDTVRLLFIHNPDVAIQDSLKICMILSFIYIFFDGLRWVFSGLLVAAGDTLFLLIAGSLSVWVFLLAPVYFIVVRHHLPVEYAWGTTVLYAAIFFVVYWIRFKQGAWQKIDLITPEQGRSLEGKPPEAACPTLPEFSDPQG